MVTLKSIPSSVVMLACLVGCGGAIPGDDDATPAGGREVEIIATEYSFSPSAITADAGEVLTITLVNQGNDPHNITFEFPEGEVGLNENVPPGESRTTDITVTSVSGNSTFYCPIGNHFELGMEGVLTVE